MGNWKGGARSYELLLPFLNADSDEERIHALNAFGADLDDVLIDALLVRLVGPSTSRRAQAGLLYVLSSSVPVEKLAPRLLALARSSDKHHKAIAVGLLGQFPPSQLAAYVDEPNLIDALRPLLLFLPHSNWTRSKELLDDIAFVPRQSLI